MRWDLLAIYGIVIGLYVLLAWPVSVANWWLLVAGCLIAAVSMWPGRRRR